MDNASKRTARPFLASPDFAAPLPAYWQPDMDLSDIEPAFSLQPHGGNADGPTTSPYAPTIPIQGLTCIHPGCEAPPCPDEAALDQHMRLHFGRSSGSQIPHVPGFDPGAMEAHCGMVGSGTPASERMTPLFGGFTTGHNAVASSPRWNALATSGQPARPSVAMGVPAASPVDQRFHCTYPDCGASTKSQADFARHAKKHGEGPKEFDCPIRNCPRTGVDGFSRKDKMNDHLKAKHKLSPA